MAYIGNVPAEAYSTLSKQTITGDSGTSYTLDYAVATAQDIEVFVNNVRQEPGVAYTVAGTALTMTGAVSASDDFYVVFQGKAVQTVVPADNTVTTAMLQDGVVTAGKLNSTLDLTGKTVTLPAASSGAVLLANVDSTSTVASVEISLDYAGYSNFILHVYALGDSSSSGENLDLQYRRDGEASFDTTGVYGCQNILVDNATTRNVNSSNTSVELMTTNLPTSGWTSTVYLNGFGDSDRPSEFHFFTSASGATTIATWVGGGGYASDTLKLERIVELSLSYTAGNITTCRYQLYGMKS